MSVNLGKVDELLSVISLEYSNIAAEANSLAVQNQKGMEFQVNQQMKELQTIRNKIYELELTHKKMKQDYEEEINRLKFDISNRDNQINSFRSSSTAQPLLRQQQPSIPLHVSPPNIQVTTQSQIHNNNTLVNPQLQVQPVQPQLHQAHAQPQPQQAQGHPQMTSYQHISQAHPQQQQQPLPNIDSISSA